MFLFSIEPLTQFMVVWRDRDSWHIDYRDGAGTMTYDLSEAKGAESRARALTDDPHVVEVRLLEMASKPAIVLAGAAKKG